MPECRGAAILCCDNPTWTSTQNSPEAALKGRCLNVVNGSDVGRGKQQTNRSATALGNFPSDSLSQATVVKAGRCVVCRLQHWLFLLPPCYTPRASTLRDCSHGLGSHEWGPPSTALKLTPLPSWIKQLMVLCHLFSPARCSSPSFLPQVLSSRCSLRSPSPQVSCCNTTSPMWHHWASQGAEGVIFSTSSILPNTPIQMAES